MTKMTTKSTKDIDPIHKDRIGQIITINSYIVYSQNNHLQIGIVKKINPKMIGISRLVLNKKSWSTGYANKYPDDCVVVDGARVTMLLLNQS